MLERNIARISALAKELLAFSKGRPPHAAWVDPGRLLAEVAALYRDAAQQENIRLVCEVAPGLAPAPWILRGSTPASPTSSPTPWTPAWPAEARFPGVPEVSRGTGALVFEVRDEGCGIDYDVKQKIFTSFFSTKDGVARAWVCS